MHQAEPWRGDRHLGLPERHALVRYFQENDLLRGVAVFLLPDRHRPKPPRQAQVAGLSASTALYEYFV